ncbi:hypothetical protein FA15DRAFT_546393, partial [Coprinopsis marcescibilis]
PKQRARQKPAAPPPKTGRTEMSSEWAKHLVATRSFALLGPGERREGGNPKDKPRTVPEKLVTRLPPRQQTAITHKDTLENSPTPASIANTVVLKTTTDALLGLNIPELIKTKYVKCAFFKNVVTNPRHYKNFEMEGYLLYMKTEEGKRMLTIPDCKHEGRNIRELIIAEAHTLLAHLGTRKTLNYLRDHVWWK